MQASNQKDTPAACALRVWMAKHRIGTKELAAQLGCTDFTVRSWRICRRTPERDLALALERITGGEVAAALWGAKREAA